MDADALLGRLHFPEDLERPPKEIRAPYAGYGVVLLLLQQLLLLLLRPSHPAGAHACSFWPILPLFFPVNFFLLDLLLVLRFAESSCPSSLLVLLVLISSFSFLLHVSFIKSLSLSPPPFLPPG